MAKIVQCCLIITDVIHVNKAEKGLMLVWQRPTVLFDDCELSKVQTTTPIYRNVRACAGVT